MDKKTLRQYRTLKKELKDLDRKLDKLYDKSSNIPDVLGKVTGSSAEFPYIEVHPTVQMAEPRANDNINRLIRAKKNRRDMVEKVAVEVEEFIQQIPDSTGRIVFEEVFISGKKQNAVADELGYTKGRVTQIINKYVKD